MTTYEKAVKIIGSMLNSHHMAVRILDTLLDNRITMTTMRASPDLFTRFHAHCRFLGEEPSTQYGYEYWYNLAIAYAVEQDAWPVKLIPKTISIDGHDITVDIQVSQSTRLATNRQLLIAYSVIVDGAKQLGVMLPENVEKEAV